MMPSPPIERPLRHLPLPLARRRQRPRSHPSPRFAPRHTANRLARRAAGAFTPPCSPLLYGKPSAATAPAQPHQALPRGSIPIAPAAPPLPHRPRFRALALFGRRPYERVDGLVIAGVRKPAQKHKGDITRIHSNTSSARPDRGNGTVIPSALAVLRFRNSSTLVDC